MKHPRVPGFSFHAAPIETLSGIISGLRKLSAATFAAAVICVPTAPSTTPVVANNSSAQSPVAHFTHRDVRSANPSRRSRRPRAVYASHPVVIFDKDFAIGRQSLWNIPTPASDDRERTHRIADKLPVPPSLTVEARILCRLLVALVVGGIIGVERRAANSLAGVRTFSLVSLGAAILMSTSMAAFPSADPTRIAAAISSSVGFLGAGAINKNSKQSRGLTTASSVWLAAALGIASATGMFLLSFSGAIVTVLTARYARFDSSLHRIRASKASRNGNDDAPDSAANGAQVRTRDASWLEENDSSWDQVDDPNVRFR